MDRRQFVHGAGGALLALNGVTFASAKRSTKKVVWLVLRGALDSLHTVIPYSDRHLLDYRASLVEPIQDEMLPIDEGFYLNPSLTFLHQLYRRGQLAPVVAVSTPYRARSHFDGQDLLEGGKHRIEQDSGWLARAIDQHNRSAIAIDRSIPIVLRGSKLADSWYPSRLQSPEDELYARLANVYEGNEYFENQLIGVMDSDDLIKSSRASGRPAFEQLAVSGAEMLRNPKGPDAVTLELGGWDTHDKLVTRMRRRLRVLDGGIKALHNSLGDMWDDTLLVIATEFGRTVRVNGTKGTDHGTGTTLILAGGSVNGGQVLGDWPGLRPSDLFDNRDLRPTSNVFDWLATALAQHWQIPSSGVLRVFPGSKTLDKTLFS